MFKNYFKIAFRSLSRNRVTTGINVSGLALGIAACLLIVLYIQNELSYDRFNTKANRIVRVVLNGKMQGGDVKEASVMPPVAETLKKDFPEVEDATRIRPYGYPRIAYGGKVFKENSIAFVDSNFFRVFTLPLLKGDPSSVLVQPNTIVISKRMATKYFGDGNPIGKVLEFKDNNASATVTGLFDEMPANSHFHFDVLVSMSSLNEARSPSWMTSNFFTYLVLPEHYDYHRLEAKLPQEVDKYIGPQIQQGMGVTMQQFRANGNSVNLMLQPLTDIHLHSDLTGDMEPHGNVSYMYIFGVVAVFMLLIACINFMNLSTAAAFKRAKEVGIRKVMGSLKGQLVRQFMMESLILTMLSLVISLFLVKLALPLFNTITDQRLDLGFSSHPWMIPGLLLFGIFTALLAGSYPAFFLSSFNPIAVLKGGSVKGKGSRGLRSGLVVFQFFISISLMVGTMVVYRQLSFMRNKDLGYNKDQVIVVQDIYWLGQNREAFRHQLSEDPRIVSVTSSGYLPAGPSNNNNFFVYPDDSKEQMIKTLRYGVDENYIPTLGMSIVEGRNFSKAYGSDSNAVVLNQSAVRAYGWKGNPIAHTITHANNDGSLTVYHVIGVVKDFHFRSLHEAITPLVMTLGGDVQDFIVKVNTKDVAGVLSSMQKHWTALTSEYAFSYSFLDQRFDNMYRFEQNIGLILGVFAGLTIFVACLGLFGLAMFTTAQRTREVGIRKILGADVTGLVLLLSKDFLKLVGVAFLIAAPVAWWGTDLWLQGFAYRVSISWWIFGAAAFIALLVALLTISSQAAKAAFANPVKSLRAE